MMVKTMRCRSNGWTWAVLAIGCSPASEEIGVVDETGDADDDDDAAGSSGTDGPADGATTPGQDDDDDTAADDDAEDGDTAASAEESSTNDPGSTDAGEDACIAEDWPACQVEACVQAWTFECGACPEEQSHPLCFGLSEGCEFPWLDCAALPASPCGSVWALGSRLAGPDTIDHFEDEAAAVCMLEALRDGVPGTYEIRLGIQFDEGPLVVEMLVGADGSAVMQWDFECMNCFGGGDNGRSGRLALQPTTYFDDCLEAPTTESLALCIFGFVEFDNPALPPDGWTPAFTTGECSALEFACPPG